MNKLYNLALLLAVLILIVFIFNQARGIFLKNQNQEAKTNTEDVRIANTPINQVSDANCQIENMDDKSYRPKLAISPGGQQGFTLYREMVSGLEIRAGKDYEYSDVSGLFSIKFKNTTGGIFNELSQIKLSENCHASIKNLDAEQSITYIYSKSIKPENQTEDRYKLATLLAENIQNYYKVEVSDYQAIEEGRIIKTANDITAIVDIFQFKTNQKIYTGAHAMYTKNGYAVFSSFIYPATLIKSDNLNSDLDYIQRIMDAVKY
jgi:mRNA-degrading endonuclease RelE of RelBE toxin-antitoxin system